MRGAKPLRDRLVQQGWGAALMRLVFFCHNGGPYDFEPEEELRNRRRDSWKSVVRLAV